MVVEVVLPAAAIAVPQNKIKNSHGGFRLFSTTPSEIVAKQGEGAEGFVSKTILLCFTVSTVLLLLLLFTCLSCHTPRQPLRDHPSGHLGGWATPWSTEEMLDGQRQRVDILAHARTAHKGLLQKKTGRGSLPNRPTCHPPPPSPHHPRRSNRSKDWSLVPPPPHPRPIFDNPAGQRTELN